MVNRRILMTAALLSVLAAPLAWAQSWKSQYPELVFAVIPAENASGVTERFQPWIDYLAKTLGVKITLRIANDYAAVIEGQKAGNIHVAYYGPASFARALKVTHGGIEAFATTINQDGTIGYYSVAYVKAESPYHSLEDLKGKNLGLVDPNSTSGNNMPRFAMDKMGIDPEKFFSKVVYAGSHENAVMALEQGSVDVAFDWWNSDSDSNLTRMVNKGMVRKQDFRIIFTSPLLPGAPYAVLASLPDDLKVAIKTAFVEGPHNDKAAFDRLSDGKDRGFKAVGQDDYKAAIELIDFVDRLHRKQPS